MMSLYKAILKRVLSNETITSPPPPESVQRRLAKQKKHHVPRQRYGIVEARVDASPPTYSHEFKLRKFQSFLAAYSLTREENIRLVKAIRKTHLEGGKVDSHWAKEPIRTLRFYYNRVDFLRRVQRENRDIYHRLQNITPRVLTAKELESEWKRNRAKIVWQAHLPFVLFEPIPQEILEDEAFRAPPGVKRPRVLINFRVQNGASIGTIKVELFTDICPHTTGLFLDLLRGDDSGYSYIGKSFFSKVPALYWSGGDVIYDNGFGCYAQKGRFSPIGAENYHFSHSIPGLMSMRVTKDDEMCGIFNITFKELRQFDLQNVVFGRIIRPCGTFETMKTLGAALSSKPVVYISYAIIPRGKSSPPSSCSKSTGSVQIFKERDIRLSSIMSPMS